jgi:hypothetical protein
VSKRKALLAAAVTVAVSAVTLAVPAPASADESLGTTCSTRDRSLGLGGTAFFTGGDPLRTWTEFTYTLWGEAGDRSDVNIRVYVGGRTTPVFERKQKDNRKPGVLYHEVPNPPLITHDSNPETVWFEAIFDKFGHDPRCLASTEPV